MSPMRFAAAVLVAGFVSSPLAVAQGVLRHHDGPNDMDSFGGAVAIAGDVDGDGTDDYVVGAPGAGGVTKPGEAYVYSGRTGALIWSWSGQFNNNKFGAYVAGAGDPDYDGYADILIGAPDFAGVNTLYGKVYLYSGQTGAFIREVIGGKGEHAGPVAGIGDVTRDAIDDYVLGIPYSSSGAPSGGFAISVSGPTGNGIWKLAGPVANELFGSAFAVVGDWDGDNANDVAIGAPSSTTLGALGTVYVHSGDDGSLVTSFAGAETMFGSSLAAVGDVDGDPLSELLIGSPEANGGVGAAYLYSGISFFHIHTFNGVSGVDGFGVSVSGAGDVNGDGINDILIGSRADPSPGFLRGRFHVYSGDQAAGFPLLTTLQGHHDQDGFGTAVAGFTPFNAGKFADFVIGAPGTDGAGTDRGAVDVFKGDDLFLFPDRREYLPGDIITLDTRIGNPGSPAHLFVATFVGIPVWTLIFSGSFDPTGDFSLIAAVPPGLSGTWVEFCGFGFDPSVGRFRATELMRVDFF